MTLVILPIINQKKIMFIIKCRNKCLFYANGLGKLTENILKF